MCGLAGILPAPGRRLGPEDRERAHRMAETLRHRGPDARTSWISPSGGCAFGHARLRIVDLETGGQPMHTPDGRRTVVFNGEIYNFRELRAELERGGHRFRTRCDTEVLLHAHAAWGEAMLERLEGMFAFALWDEEAGTLLLARDRAGQKPLFLHRTGDGSFLFASELKALREAGMQAPVSDRAVQLYLAYGYVPGGETALEGVERLLPGEFLRIERDGTETRRRWWRLDWTPHEMSKDEAVRGVRDRMAAAVESRLVADVPLGALLSGGVDSSIVVGLMAGAMDRPVDTFSMGFDGQPNYDETGWARRMADRFGTKHTEFRIDADAGAELLDPLVEMWDEPFGDSSAIPTSEVCRHTRGAVTVALCGDGGDELFAGYPRFLGAVLADRVPGPLASLGRTLSRALPWRDDFRHPFRRAHRFFDAASSSEAERTLRWIGYLHHPPDEITPRARRVIETRDEVAAPFQAILDEAPGLSSLRRQLRLNWETYLPDDLLVKADRASMMHSLELRAPFLDHRLAEFVAGVPDRYLVGRGQLKRLLQDAFSDLLPAEVFARRKMGFGVPLPAWFRGAWKARFEAEVLAADARSAAWVRREPVRRIWAEHQSGSADHGHALWALTTLELWLRRWG